MEISHLPLSLFMYSMLFFFRRGSCMQCGTICPHKTCQKKIQADRKHGQRLIQALLSSEIDGLSEGRLDFLLLEESRR